MKTNSARRGVMGAAVLLLPCVAIGTPLTDLAAAAGATPEAVTAAGFTPAEATAWIQRLSASPWRAQVESTRSAVAATMSQLEAALRDGTADTPPDTLAELLQRAEQLRNELSQSLAALRLDAGSDLDPADTARLECIVAAQRYEVPIAWMVVERSPEEWAGLQAALRLENRSLRRGEDLDGDLLAFLAAARAEPESVAAEHRLREQLAAVTAAMLAVP